jgi:hypothetical protein
MLCPKCKHSLFSRKLLTYTAVLINDDYCPICGWSAVGSQDPQAQAEHDAELAKLASCSVDGCPNKITTYSTPNEWGMCWKCASKHKSWLEGGRSKYPPFVNKGNGRWRINPLAGQWRDSKLKNKILKRQIEYCER